MLTKGIPISDVEMSVFRKMNKLISKKVKNCLQMRVYYQRLEAEFNKYIIPLA